MAALTLHHFEGRALRSVSINGEPWFVAADAAAMLEHRDADKLTRGLDDDEKGTHSVGTPGGDQDMSVISEPGMYRAIVQRRATKAISPEVRERIARFQRWVFHEVLPSIRRTGRYALSTSSVALEESTTVRRQLVAECRQTFGTLAARQLWLRLGLDRVPAMFVGSAQGDLFDQPAMRCTLAEWPS